jgi:three-Cys-motif partner protein
MHEPYEGREQSLVKHYILRKYLERFAHIVGTWADSITYVDCFSGPWNAHTADLHDTSFSIALNELRKAKATLSEHGRHFSIRCFFLEDNAKAYYALKAWADEVNDATVLTKRGKFEKSVSEILAFIAQERGSFPFIFIDPTGWAALEREVITPLLRTKPGEVLINFMTGHIRRFATSSDAATRQSFIRMFGPYLPTTDELDKLTAEDRDDMLVNAYMQMVRGTGEFPYVCNAIILDPEIDATQFHLIYATRSVKGVEVFKAAERAAMGVQSEARANAKARRREQQTGMATLFSPQAMDDPTHTNALVNRYVRKAKTKVLDQLVTRSFVPYDDLWVAALSEPLAQEADLKDWLATWQKTSLVAVRGMPPRQRVPRYGQKIVVERLVSPEMLRQRV